MEDEEQTGYVSTFKYVGKLEDDEKQLTCQYIPANGGEIGDNSVTLKIQKHILPQSPYIVDTPYKVGDTVTTSIEMDLYPKPEARSLVWVIEDPQQIEEKIEMNNFSLQNFSSQVFATGITWKYFILALTYADSNSWYQNLQYYYI